MSDSGSDYEEEKPKKKSKAKVGHISITYARPR